VTNTVDLARSSFTRAVTVVVPSETAVTTPVESTTATLGSDDVHSTPLGVVTKRPIDVADNVKANELPIWVVPPMTRVFTAGVNVSARPGGANGSVRESPEHAMHVAAITSLARTEREARIKSPLLKSTNRPRRVSEP
jgi:hypothetical protein